MASNKHFDLRKIENSGTAIFKNTSFFLNKRSKALGQIKAQFSFWLYIDFGKMASNKDVDLRKIENFVISKYYP